MPVDELARMKAAGKTPVDAYSMAVAGGYTGTKEQFEADLAASETNASNAASSATAAAGSAESVLPFALNYAPAYSSSGTYAEGDMAVYDGLLYECTEEEITAGEEFDPSKWVHVPIMPSATELNGEIEAFKQRTADSIHSSASGTIASFPDGAAAPVAGLTVGVEPVQAGSGDPSPTNIRPITGHTGANIYDDPAHGGTINWNQLRRGDSASYTYENITTSYDSETGLCKITNDSRTTKYNTGSTQVMVSNVAPIENHKYIMLTDHLEAGVCISMVDGSAIKKTVNMNEIVTGPSGATSFKLRITNNYDFVTAHPVGNEFTFHLNIFDLTQMFGEGNEPASVSDFTAFFPKDWYAFNTGELTCVSAVNGDPHRHVAIDWEDEAGTVYGGTLNVTTGVLTVDRAYKDLGNIVWSKSVTNYRTFRGILNGINYKYRTTTVLCSSYAATNGNDATAGADNYIWCDGTANISVKDTSKESLTDAEFKTAVTGVQLVYELATPVTYQLTPTEVETLLGTNNIWADTGDTTVNYRADTKLYIEQLTKPGEDDMTANANIASGKFFMIGNRLFLSTSAIAQGATIVPGTNCTEISLADALNQIGEN